MLDQIQVETLLKPVKHHRVQQNAQGQSHLPAYDVTAHLNRIFGFDGWDKEIVKLELVHCFGSLDQPARVTRPKRDGGSYETWDLGRWWATYSCTMRLTVRGPDGKVVAVREDAATGSAQNQPSPGDAHDMAIKSAVSYALKRCAKDWGDQFGLSLYNGGSEAPLVGVTLVKHDHTVDEQAAAALEQQEHHYADEDPERPFE